MSALRIGALAWRVARGGSVAAWAERLERAVAEAVRNGAQLLFSAEYAPLEVALGSEPDLAAELRTAVARAPEAVAAAQAIARRHGVWLLPGTLPFREPAGPVNRAPLIAPDGTVAWQDKHVMTRFEAEEWGITPGRPPAVFETAFGRIGIAICFDAEFPALVRAQVEAGAWLILVPSCTDTLAGYHRVTLACAARAMENQCFVAMAPTVGGGTVERRARHEPRRGGGVRPGGSRLPCGRRAGPRRAGRGGMGLCRPRSGTAGGGAPRRRGAQPSRMAAAAAALPRAAPRMTQPE